jgi:Fe-Mn family superoxide dismutase
MKTLRCFQFQSSLLLLCALLSGQAGALDAPSATLPLLLMDLYEHSYQMDHDAAAPAYVHACFRNIHWEAVSTSLDESLKTRAIWIAGESR